MKYVIITLLFSILFSQILTINPSKQLIGDGGDTYQYFGFMNLVKQNLDSFKHPFAYTKTYQYPIGFNFSFGFDGALPVLTGALLSYLLPLPLAFNIVIVLILWANCYVGYICFKKIGSLINPGVQIKNDAYYLIPAILFGWSPYVFGRLNGHINLSFIAGFPVCAYAVTLIIINVKKNVTNRLYNYLLFFGSLLIVAGGSLQYLIQLSQIIVLMFLCSLILRFRPTLLCIKKILQSMRSDQIIFIFISGMVIALPFFFIYYGYFYAFFTHQFMTAGIHNNSPLFIPSLWDFLMPNSYLGAWWGKINPSFYELERIASYGIFGNIFILFFIAQNKFLFRSRTIFIVFFATIIFGKFIPFLLIPEPARVFVGFSLITALIISSVRIKIPNIVLFLIIALFIGERFFYRIQIAKILPIEAGNIVKNLPGKAVLNIPVSDHSQRGLLPYVWNKSIVDGSLHYPARTKNIYELWNNPFVNRLICLTTQPDTTISPQDIQNELERLYKLQIKTIVIHKQGPGEFWWFKECSRVREFWNTIVPDKIINSEKNEVITHKIEYGRQAPIHSNLIAEKGGLFELSGMTLWPSDINDFSIATQESNIIFPLWKIKSKKDLVADFNPPLLFTLQPKQQMLLFSNKTVNNNTYVGIYYRFIPNNLLYANNYPKNKFTIDFVWKNDDMEIYSIVQNK